ncbi:MAG TPA: hypothetical protein VFF67_08940 [Thermoplasmata archaeon]|nr:hypothetical protein [Thermoplasmata archaeon]
MKPRALAWALAAATIFLVAPALGGVNAPAPIASPSAVFHYAVLPAPVRGTVTNCTSNWDCTFAFNTSKGTGWADGAGVSYYRTGLFSFRLPGEAKASYNLTYSTYIARLNGTYTYWTVGNFFGTDVNTGKVVYGTTNTNYTITCHGHSGRGGGCSYTYTTDNGTVLVKFTNAEITSTAIACTPTFTHPGGKVSCTVTVTNGWNASNYTTGSVRVSSGGTGSLSNKGVCALTKGSCNFTYRPSDNTCGSVTLTATYHGTTAYYRSFGSILISVYVSGGC